MSFEHWIEENMQVTDADIKAYFNGAKKYRGMYFLEMKRQLALRMIKQGYKQREISQILKMSTPMVSIYKNHTKPLDAESLKLVEENKDKWIAEGLYPKSKQQHSCINYTPEFKTVFELVKAYQL
jgi:predicted transcriptional regulator